jgi:hypothetical protein
MVLTTTEKTVCLGRVVLTLVRIPTAICPCFFPHAKQYQIFFPLLDFIVKNWKPQGENFTRRRVGLLRPAFEVIRHK